MKSYVLVAVLLAACHKGTPPAAGATAAATAREAAVIGPTTSVHVLSAVGELHPGGPAPAFTAKAHDGTSIDTTKLQGKPVVVYFYPKDETPGCTKEACSFRDAWDKLDKAGVVLIGVSADSDESHREFASHHKLPFLLVSDPDGRLAEAFGVPFASFHERQSFVLEDGKVRAIFRKVNVAKHADEIALVVGG